VKAPFSARKGEKAGRYELGKTGAEGRESSFSEWALKEAVLLSWLAS